jgi:hypothetical protein
MGNKKTLAIIPSLDKDSTLETLKNIVLIPYNGLSDVKLLKLSTTSDRINYNFSSLTISTPELANVTSGNIIISHKKQDLTFLKEFYAKLYSTLSVCNQLSLDQCSTKLSQEIPNIRVIKQNNLLLIITKLKDTELKLLVNPTAPLPLLDLDMNSAQDYVLNGEKLVPQESDETLNKMRESLQKVYLLKPRM